MSRLRSGLAALKEPSDEFLHLRSRASGVPLRNLDIEPSGGEPFRRVVVIDRLELANFSEPRVNYD